MVGYGEDEITINYEESKVWGIKLYDKDNLLVNSTDTNIRDTRVCHTTPFFRVTDRLHAAGTALFFEDTTWGYCEKQVHADVISLIKQYIRNSNCPISYEHVYGHLDDIQNMIEGR